MMYLIEKDVPSTPPDDDHRWQVYILKDDTYSYMEGVCKECSTRIRMLDYELMIGDDIVPPNTWYTCTDRYCYSNIRTCSDALMGRVLK